MSDPLVNLQEVERSCAERYLSLLGNTLGENLRVVWLFGSFARGDMWPAHMPMNSDTLNAAGKSHRNSGLPGSSISRLPRRRRHSGSAFLAKGKYCCHEM